MLAFAKSDIGHVRKTNEDSYVFSPPELFVVADGMGGHEAGEIASSLAVATIEEHVKKYAGTAQTAELLIHAILKANQSIFQMAQQRPECAGMGTTVTAVYIEGETIYWGHVGDSRLYLLRDGDLLQLTQDHSLVGELLQSGSITPEEAHVHPHRNILTRAVGTAEQIQVDCGSFTWSPEEQILLCTDGLTGLVSDSDIRNTLIECPEVVSRVEHLIAKALAEGGYDNVTAILVQHEG